MILESVENGPLVWPSIEENEVTRPKKYYELSATKAIQADCDVKATNIILQRLPLEEMECKLYDEFNKFAYKKGESFREFYLRFSLLLNDMNIYNMKLENFQVNTKFLNTLPPERSKFVTDVKLVRDLHITNVDQLHAYLGQHKFHANEHGSHTQSSTPLSITYPPNDFQSSVHHNVYDPSSSIPQVEYALPVNQQPDFSQPDSDPIAEAQTIQNVITHNVAYQADDLDAHDSDCDKINTAKVALKANLSHYGSDDLAEVHNQDNVTHNVINQAVQALPLSKQSNIVNQSETKITSDSNIIPFSQYKTNAIVIRKSEETLMLAEESCSKMLLKQKDPMMSEKKVNTKLVDYAALNQLSQDFETRFVPQTELSAKQVFWSQNSVNSKEPNLSTRPTQVEFPKELPKVSMLNTILKKHKHHLASFDVVVKERTTATAITKDLDQKQRWKMMVRFSKERKVDSKNLLDRVSSSKRRNF
nr:hypothetical protein [Tanacetum cinerariifolium]